MRLLTAGIALSLSETVDVMHGAVLPSRAALLPDLFVIVYAYHIPLAESKKGGITAGRLDAEQDRRYRFSSGIMGEAAFPLRPHKPLQAGSHSLFPRGARRL